MHFTSGSSSPRPTTDPESPLPASQQLPRPAGVIPAASDQICTFFFGPSDVPERKRVFPSTNLSKIDNSWYGSSDGYAFFRRPGSENTSKPSSRKRCTNWGPSPSGSALRTHLPVLRKTLLRPGKPAGDGVQRGNVAAGVIRTAPRRLAPAKQLDADDVVPAHRRQAEHRLQLGETAARRIPHSTIMYDEICLNIASASSSLETVETRSTCASDDSISTCKSAVYAFGASVACCGAQSIVSTTDRMASICSVTAHTPPRAAPLSALA